MKNQLMAVTALLALMGGAPSLFAQGKVGVVDIQSAIASTAEGKKVIADLQKKYQPRQQELQRLQQEIQSIQDQLTKQSATLSEEEQSRLNRDAEEKQKQLKRATEDAQTDFTHDRDEVIGRLGQKMVRLIGDYAQQNGFSLIIDRVQVPIYFAAKETELTEEIVKRYDAANPVADAGTAAKPPAHPATPATPPNPK